jgi:hypothetical protein
LERTRRKRSGIINRDRGAPLNKTLDVSMDRHAISELVNERANRFGTTNHQELRFIRDHLRQVQPAELFFGLLQVFCSSEGESTESQRQELAGRLLLDLMPPCELPPEQVIRVVLQSYALSVEELPWYLLRQFGERVLTTAFDKCSVGPLSSRETRSLETMRFWVRNYDPNDHEKNV